MLSLSNAFATQKSRQTLLRQNFQTDLVSRLKYEELKLNRTETFLVFTLNIESSMAGNK